MNKTELVAAMADAAEISKKDAEKALKAFTDVVADELKKGGKVQLVGFGTFEVSERAAREGRNPQSGEVMKIAASKAPKFKAVSVAAKIQIGSHFVVEGHVPSESMFPWCSGRCRVLPSDRVSAWARFRSAKNAAVLGLQRTQSKDRRF